MLSALLPHSGCPHRNQTVSLNPRMPGMCHSLIGMKQSAERQGGALLPARGLAVQRLWGLRAGQPLPSSLGLPLQPGFQRLLCALQRGLGPCVPGRRREEVHRGEAVPSQGSSGWCSQGSRPGEDGAHMGGCFCIPGELRLSLGPGEFPGGPWPMSCPIR